MQRKDALVLTARQCLEVKCLRWWVLPSVTLKGALGDTICKGVSVLGLGSSFGFLFRWLWDQLAESTVLLGYDLCTFE